MRHFIYRNFKALFAGLFFLVFLVALIFNCSNPRREKKSSGADRSGISIQKAVYVGRESCKHCHEKEYSLYTGSDHDLAMDVADSSTVLGNFNNVTYRHLGVTSKFYKKGDRYFVYTEGDSGVMKEFEIQYVFGHYPLQQYLVAFPGGRYQCLPLCWDSRSEAEGGQRWFHIYKNERIAPHDNLYWTGILQNWNYMCAECHSTDLKKNYNYKERTYHTTWKEIDVSCEACHGPGSVHVLWAEAKEKGNAPEIPFKGFTMSFKDPYNGTWVFPKDSSIARRTHPHNTRQLIAMCARCHARRGTLDEDYRFGKSLPDTHSPSLLEDNLYFADGQIKDEDYEYASFLQSKMYKAGVFCTDCHDPHSAKVYVAGNALCYRCHSAEKYGSKLHHFHNVNSAGAKCVSCHMPTRTYMAVDPRLDHSIRIPRPDLTLKLGTPNACNQCHSDKTAQWALNAFKKWYGDPSRFGTHYGEVIAEARKASPLVKQDLIQWATDTSASPMVRATMLSLMQNVPGATEEQPVIRELSDPDPLVRYGAEQAASILNNNEKSKYLFKALKDSVLLIRTNAASILTTSQVNFENQKDQELLSQVTGEYILTQLTNADFPSSWLNLGLLYWSQHRSGAAEEAYKRSIELGPGLPYGYINLADLYRQENREEDGEKILREGLSENPSMAGVHYALALLLVRKQDQENAIRELKTAVKLEPDNPEYNYTLGIAMYSSGDPGMAVSILEKALTSSPYNQEILYALATINRDLHQSAKALHYADLLVKYYPENRNFLLLRNSLAQ